MTPSPASPSIDRFAQDLLRAWRGGDVATPVALASPAEAYAAQDRLFAALDGDAVPRHWKSGGPSRETALTHAPLPRAGVRASGGDTAGLPLRLRLVEAEIALRLARDVTAQEAAALRPGDADGLVDAMCVSIELVDSRLRDGRAAPALARLADLQSHGALVLGAFVPFRAVDWSQQACHVRIGPAPEQVFRGTHSLGTPTWLLAAWLQHATARFGTVPAGTVVTTGTWCGLLEAQAGDRVEVAFPGIGSAAVQFDARGASL